MSLASLAAALAQSALILILGWIAADILLRPLFARSPELLDRFGTPERLLAAVCGFVLLALVLMVCHIVSGGAVFGTAAAVPVATLAILILGVVRKVAWPRPRSWAALLAATAVIGALYILPLVIAGTGARTGDTPWHMGWTQQLLAGEPVPTGPAPDFGRNAYPWGWHAVNATLVRALPGSDVVVAHDALQLTLVLAIPLAAACLARLIHRRAGWAAAASASLIGGWGWLSTLEPTFIASPTAARYGADLVVASPNSVYELFAPAFPRELGLVLLAGAGMFIVIGAGRSVTRLAVLGGLVLGSVGVVSVPMMFGGVVWALFGLVAVEWGRRIRFAVLTLAPATLVFSVWATPVLVDYLRFDGFVDVTPQLGVEWPLPTALGAWGLLTPLALGGAIVALRAQARRETRIVLWFSAGTIAMLVLARARAALDWDLAGNATVLHQGRVWPVAHLLGAAFAGIALVWLYDRLDRRRPALSVAVVTAVLLVGSLSLVIASAGFGRVLALHEDGFEFNKPDRGSGSFVQRTAAHLGPDDVVEVRGSNELAFMLFSFSGMRIASYDDPRLETNDLRIRFTTRAAAWDAQMDGGGFEPDYEVVPIGAGTIEDALETGDFEGQSFVLRATNN
ncbi:MAG: hypothetical protein M3391_03600 [Actinomycetota bacterium]|nr:hypothetical protein [Actinomycetota bacterium]